MESNLEPGSSDLYPHPHKLPTRLLSLKGLKPTQRLVDNYLFLPEEQMIGRQKFDWNQMLQGNRMITFVCNRGKAV